MMSVIENSCLQKIALLAGYDFQAGSKKIYS